MAEIAPPRAILETDDRAAFDCGRESLNAWFRRYGWSNHAAGVSRTNVICSSATGAVAGFVTLSGAHIERQFLAKARQRNLPDPLPVTLLGQLAVYKDFQGRGHAASLLQFALRTSLRASQEIGSFGVITHPIDDRVREFYCRCGFEDLPGDPRQAMIVRMADLERNGFG